jgi:predicted Zn-dependent peptidase
MLVYQQDRLGNEDPGMLEIKAEMLKAVLRSILLKRLREEMGKVYSVSVSSASGPYPSFLSRTSIAFVCQPSDVDMLIDTVQSELQRFYAHPEQFADYLEDVKKNLIKENALQKQKSSYWTSWIRNAVYYNRENWNFLNHYDESVNSQTVNDIARFARWAISDANEIKAVLLP